eukprot:TRINITY_DN15687_c1_g1_i1.p1 TRINITY_DN15687_c1_g1~~TRINITY_DN15687_c1_g1_i1.p1  ORF type:complete len:349 (+),score=38.19 TRINITY_DN15687_c1_g1_i1:77-1048(+)
MSIFCLANSHRAGAVRVHAQIQNGAGQIDSARHVVITGCNTGIGFETAKALSYKGFSTTLACRDTDKAQAAKQQILEAVPEADVDILELKLDNLSSVSDAAKKLLDSEKEIDVLINNAGVMGCPEMLTDDGFEYQLGVNHFGHFLFTYCLLPKLLYNSNSTRIVNVASEAHVFGELDLNDLLYKQKKYDGWKCYARSKLANILFTYELARMIKAENKCTVNCLHPGLVATDLGRHMFPNTPWNNFVLRLASPFFKAPSKGAQTTIYVASSPEVEGVTSKYYKDCKAATSSPASYDGLVSAQLWERSLEMTKCDQFAPEVSSLS